MEKNTASNIKKTLSSIENTVETLGIPDIPLGAKETVSAELRSVME